MPDLSPTRLRVLALPLVLALALVSLTPQAQAQAPQAAAPVSAPPVEVRVVVMVAVEDEVKRREIEAEFHRQYPSYAAEHDLMDAAADVEKPELLLRLQFLQPEEDVDLVMIHSTAISEHGTSMEAGRACLHCTPAELIADSLTNIGRAALAVVEQRPEPAASPARSSPQAPPEPPAPVAKPKVAWIGPLGYSGIASTALGLGGAIAGAIEMSELSESTSAGPRGPALLGVGVGLMVVGTVLLGVDLGVLLPRRQGRAQARLEGVGLSFTNGPGLVVSGRF